ncbi:MAG: hypothetical protein NXY57DRAFT_1001476 [Lentinula lateritia]|nr:MAG: hypothetical protein NXY57DRAFT_1001476 [Lentinula lateritia]
MPTTTTTTVAGRTKHAKAILGDELHKKLGETKVLVVGAGGIGCELIKTLVLSGFIDITLLDLDTIDLSNLNRQFLFRTTHIKKPKSLIAASVASTFNPLVDITPIQDNIMDSEKYHVDWFRGFDIVLNALDNLEARKYVGRMCVAGGVKMVESGTAGYLGQVQPIVGGVTECFECMEKPKGGKTYPVCTIRSTPSLPIHCVVWSKSYLMGQLFGVDEDAGAELDEAEKQGENAEEIANLRKEAESFAQVRAAIRSGGPAARMIFDKIFNTDIKRLLSMSDMWNHRASPVPLDFDRIMQGENENGNGSKQKQTVALKDQKKLTTKENLELFVSSVSALSARLSSTETVIEFDKDDDDTLNFVTAASNLRSLAYRIPQKTKWEVKEMAGNIIPAIATTNAIIAGLIVLQGVNLIASSFSPPTSTPTSPSPSPLSSLRNIHIQLKPSVPLSAITTSRPNPACGICRDIYTVVRCDPLRATLRDVVQGVLGLSPPPISEFTIFASSPSAPSATRILADPDWEDNLDRTLGSVNVRCGMFVNVVHEEGVWETISVGIGGLPPDAGCYGGNANRNRNAEGEGEGEGIPWLMLPDPLPRLVVRKEEKEKSGGTNTPLPPPPVERASLKRGLGEDDDIVVLDSNDNHSADAHPPAAKRRKTSSNPPPSTPPERQHPARAGFSSPSKKRKLEEDGLVLMESAEELLDDISEDINGGEGDVIVID